MCQIRLVLETTSRRQSKVIVDLLTKKISEKKMMLLF